MAAPITIEVEGLVDSAWTCTPAPICAGLGGTAGAYPPNTATLDLAAGASLTLSFDSPLPEGAIVLVASILPPSDLKDPNEADNTVAGTWPFDVVLEVPQGSQPMSIGGRTIWVAPSPTPRDVPVSRPGAQTGPEQSVVVVPSADRNLGKGAPLSGGDAVIALLALGLGGMAMRSRGR